MWDQLDLRAILTLSDQPVRPIDPDRMSVVAREILPEWAQDWGERRQEARDKAATAAKETTKANQADPYGLRAW